MLDPQVVRHHDAVEAPALTKDGREQLARRGTGHTVEIVVRVHHRADACVANRGLEGKEEAIEQLAHADVGGRLVEPAFGQAVAHHVLARGDDGTLPVGVLLDAPHIGAAQLCRQVRILAVRLLEPAPSGITRDVQDRCQRLAGTGRSQVPADPASHQLGQGRVPCRRQADGLGEAGRVTGHDPVQGLLVEDGRDPQPRLLDKEALDGVAQLHHLLRGQIGGAGHASDLPQSVRYPLARACRVELVAIGQLEGPRRAELRDLLRHAHPGQQVERPFLDGS